MKEDLELTNSIVNGWWYTFLYDCSDNQVKKVGYDREPLIYCISPDDKNINCFWGINLHHLKTAKRIKLFEKMLSDKQFNRDEKRYFYTVEQILSYINEVNPKYAGIRCYDRRKVKSAFRIKNQEIGKYLNSEGHLLMSNPTQRDIEYNLHSRETK